MTRPNRSPQHSTLEDMELAVSQVLAAESMPDPRLFTVRRGLSDLIDARLFRKSTHRSRYQRQWNAWKAGEGQHPRELGMGWS